MRAATHRKADVGFPTPLGEMDSNSTEPLHDLSKRPPLKRVRKACLRCHKQKLKCDNKWPCTLCTRSSIECRENTSKIRRTRPRVSRQSGDHEQPTPRLEHLSPSRPLPEPYNLPASTSSSSTHPSPQSFSRNDVPYEERPSTYPLVNHMFEKYNSASGVRSNTDAIPGGSPSTLSQKTPKSTIGSDLSGMDLPPREVTNILLDTYFKSVHWFIMVIHEPSLRAELDEITALGTLQQTRISFVALILIILAFATNYISDEDLQILGPDFDRNTFEKSLIRKVEEKFLDICDGAHIETVQTGLLLSAYYVYFGHPKRATVVYDATLSCTKALGLHRESLWGEIDPLTREIRRRVWWAVYAGDGFSAVNFGRPCSINDADWEVKMVCNIDDTSITCPGFQSVETLEDGSVERVTILSYRRCKYKLYQIVSTILKNVYFAKDTAIEETARKVKTINERLLAWERDVPPELRLTSFKSDTVDFRKDRVLETFQLQALALHLFYNNIQLLLHRPLLAYTGLPRQNEKAMRSGSNINSRLTTRNSSSIEGDVHSYQSSKNQCWDSAIQTTKIGEYRSLLLAARNTPVMPYIGIQAFTAGAVLGLFALSSPLTAVSLEAKRALGRLINMPQSLGFHNLVSEQCGNILKEMVHLILSEEMRLLISDGSGSIGEQLSNTSSISTQPSHPPSIQTETLQSQPVSQAWEQVHSSTSNTSENVWATASGEFGHISGSGNNMTNLQERPTPTMTIPPDDPQSLEMIGRDEYVSEELTYQDLPAFAAEDFNHALLSLQTVFGDERVRTNNGHNQFSEDGQSSMLPFSATSTATSFNAEIAFNDTSQTWIWGDNFNFR